MGSEGKVTSDKSKEVSPASPKVFSLKLKLGNALQNMVRKTAGIQNDDLRVLENLKRMK